MGAPMSRPVQCGLVLGRLQALPWCADAEQLGTAPHSQAGYLAYCANCSLIMQIKSINVGIVTNGCLLLAHNTKFWEGEVERYWLGSFQENVGCFCFCSSAAVSQRVESALSLCGPGEWQPCDCQDCITTVNIMGLGGLNVGCPSVLRVWEVPWTTLQGSS